MTMTSKQSKAMATDGATRARRGRVENRFFLFFLSFFSLLGYGFRAIFIDMTLRTLDRRPGRLTLSTRMHGRPKSQGSLRVQMVGETSFTCFFLGRVLPPNGWSKNRFEFQGLCALVASVWISIFSLVQPEGGCSRI